MEEKNQHNTSSRESVLHVKKLFLGILFGIIILYMFKNFFPSLFFKKTVTPEGIDEKYELPSSQKQLIDDTTYEIKKIVFEDDYAVYDVTYPYFKYISTFENEKIANSYKKFIDEHKRASKESFKVRMEITGVDEESDNKISQDDKYPLYGDFTIIQANEEYISVLFSYSAYQGGAHGFEDLRSFNYDIRNRRNIELQDIFTHQDEDMYTFLSKYARKALLHQLVPQVVYSDAITDIHIEDESNLNLIQMVYVGTEPLKENFSIYTFTPDTLTLYFGQYQVAPYSYGSPQITIER